MINRATFTGRLTKNVTLRQTPSGVSVGNFTVAVDRPFTDKNGNRGADFIRCVIWRKAAENFANFTHKGSLVGIDGRIQTGSYQNQQGETVYTTAVVVENFSLLEPRSSQGGMNAPQPRAQTQQQPQGNPNPQMQQPRQPQQPRQSQPQQNPQPQGNAPQQNNGGQNNGSGIGNDDLPF